jgi:hypothetical protein
MIDSVQIQEAQIKHGWLKVGTGKTTVLVMASCRGIPFLNYLNDLNAHNDMTLCFINPSSWDVNGTNPPDEARLASMFGPVKWFIHDTYMNHGVFNTSSLCRSRIYDLGLKPDLDISLPTGDAQILFQEIVDNHPAMKARCGSNPDDIPGDIQEMIRSMGIEAVNGYGMICRMSSFPEMEDVFKSTWNKTRYLHTSNHTSSEFTTRVFRLMNDNFLHLNVDSGLWGKWLSEDMFSSNQAPVTEYDVRHHEIQWNTPISKLRL